MSPFLHEDESLLNQKIPDYPKRAIPQAPRTIPINPWLASHYNPEESSKLPLKTQLRGLVQKIIVWGGGISLFIGVVYFGFQIFNLYR